MDTNDLWRIFLQWIHLLAAVAWIGGSLFFWLVWRPAAHSTKGQSGKRSEMTERSRQWFEQAVHREFGDVVRIAVGALLLTGAVLTFDRLASPNASALYAVVLGIKLVVAVAMVWLIGLFRPRPKPDRQFGGIRCTPEVVLILGCLTFLLAIVLRALRTVGI